MSPRGCSRGIDSLRIIILRNLSDRVSNCEDINTVSHSWHTVYARISSSEVQFISVKSQSRVIHSPCLSFNLISLFPGTSELFYANVRNRCDLLLIIIIPHIHLLCLPA